MARASDESQIKEKTNESTSRNSDATGQGLRTSQAFHQGDVFDEIQQTYDSIARRAFEIFENNGRWFGNDLGDWLRAESELLQPVRLEITDSDDA